MHPPSLALLSGGYGVDTATSLLVPISSNAQGRTRRVNQSAAGSFYSAKSLALMNSFNMPAARQTITNFQRINPKKETKGPSQISG